MVVLQLVGRQDRGLLRAPALFLAIKARDMSSKQCDRLEIQREGRCCWVCHAMPAGDVPLEQNISPDGDSSPKAKQTSSTSPPSQLPLTAPQSRSADLRAGRCLLSNFCFCYHPPRLCLLKERLLVGTHKTDGIGDVCSKLL